MTAVRVTAPKPIPGTDYILAPAGNDMFTKQYEDLSEVYVCLYFLRLNFNVFRLVGA